MDSSEVIPIEYGVYSDSEADAVAALLGEVFSRRDPPAVAVGLTASEFEDFVRLLCPALEADGLTIVARHADTRELVGVLLTQDSASPLPDGMSRLSPKFDPIFDILGQLDAEYRAGRAVRPGECLHLFLLGVSDRVAGRGVGQQLVAACLELGAKKGYRLAVTEATNKVSQHIFRKQGFSERVRRSYLSHRSGGRAVFASVADQGGPALMDRPINS
jgi:ribosomal protein S18 acetylase RimI-like enzyme